MIPVSSEFLCREQLSADILSELVAITTRFVFSFVCQKWRERWCWSRAWCSDNKAMILWCCCAQCWWQWECIWGPKHLCVAMGEKALLQLSFSFPSICGRLLFHWAASDLPDVRCCVIRLTKVIHGVHPAFKSILLNLFCYSDLNVIRQSANLCRAVVCELN